MEQRHLVGAALKTILIFMGNNSDLNKKIIKMFKMYPAVIMHLFKLQGYIFNSYGSDCIKA